MRIHSFNSVRDTDDASPDDTVPVGSSVHVESVIFLYYLTSFCSNVVISNFNFGARAGKQLNARARDATKQQSIFAFSRNTGGEESGLAAIVTSEAIWWDTSIGDAANETFIGFTVADRSPVEMPYFIGRKIISL
jgi:hypothetical protein